MSKMPTEKVKGVLPKGRALLMRVTAMAACGAVLVGCVTTQPVNKPCGVITDGLGDVQATTIEGNRRIDAHFERGVRAGCWDRSSASEVKKEG